MSSLDPIIVILGFQPPQILGYTHVGPINRGANGIVYRYTNDSTGRPVAVKVLDPQERAKEILEQRGLSQEDAFRREALGGFGQTLEGLVSFFPGRSLDGTNYLMMELVDRTLYERMQEDKPFSLDEVIRVARSGARGLRNLHKVVGLEHGDYHPGNLGLTSEGDVKLLDFGTATAGYATRIGGGNKLTRAPERFNDDGVKLTTKMDVWSFGSVLYKMFTGKYVLEKELTDPQGEFKPNATELVNLLYQSPGVWNGLVYDKIENSNTPIPKAFRKLLHRCLVHEDSRLNDGEELVKEVEKAVRKYEVSRPLSRVIRWGTTVAVTTAIGLSASTYIIKTEDQEKKIDYEQKMRIARMYAGGERTSGDIHEHTQLAKIEGLSYLFNDKKTMYAAFYNPDLVSKIVRKNGTTSWNKINGDIIDADMLTYNFAYSADDPPMDNWMMSIKYEQEKRTVQEWKLRGFDFQKHCQDLVWNYRIANAEREDNMKKGMEEGDWRVKENQTRMHNASWPLVQLLHSSVPNVYDVLEKGSFQDQMKLCEGLPTGAPPANPFSGLNDSLKLLEKYHIK
ncbi:protein kinase [Candidatus Woesearchaeota archaeon]|nr:protein kinase [Candidatus Woesearchaeota archaeon]